MNWKLLWMNIVREFIYCRFMLALVIGFIVLANAFALADNYFRLDMDGFIYGFVYAFCVIWCFRLFFNYDKALAQYLLLPSSNLEKFLSRILVYICLPLMLICCMKLVASPVHGTFFAQQFSVAKSAENMELFHPEDIEVTNSLSNLSITYRDDSVFEIQHGRFNDVVIGKHPVDSIRVGISSSAFGDFMFFVGIVGILFFSAFSFRDKMAGSSLSIILLGGLIWGFEEAIGKVFYSSMSVATTESFIFYVSLAIGAIGLYFFRRAYGIFCNMVIC